MVDFLPLLNCGLSNVCGHARLRLLMLANFHNRCPTYGVVGLMRVVGFFLRPCGGCLYFSQLVKLMETMTICASWLSFTDLPHVG